MSFPVYTNEIIAIIRMTNALQPPFNVIINSSEVATVTNLRCNYQFILVSAETTTLFEFSVFHFCFLIIFKNKNKKICWRWYCTVSVSFIIAFLKNLNPPRYLVVCLEKSSTQKIFPQFFSISSSFSSFLFVWKTIFFIGRTLI